MGASSLLLLLRRFLTDCSSTFHGNQLTLVPWQSDASSAHYRDTPMPPSPLITEFRLEGSHGPAHEQIGMTTSCGSCRKRLLARQPITFARYVPCVAVHSHSRGTA